MVALTPPTSTFEAGTVNTVVATLRDSTGRNLGGKSIVFVLTPTSGAPIVRSTIADYWGSAPLGPITVPAGTYSVVAHFGGTTASSPVDENYLGSQSTAVSVTVNAVAPPTIVATAKNADTSTYVADTWTSQNVVVNFVCNDTVGVTSCSPAQTLTAEGVTPSVVGTVLNTRGTSATTTFGPVKIDRTGPVISVTSPTSGATFTVGNVVNAAYSCTDAGVGLGTCVGPVPNGQVLDTTTPGLKSFTVNATDALGNSTPQTVTYTVASGAVGPVVSANMGIVGLEDVGFPTNAVVVSGTFTSNGGSGPFTAAVRWRADASFSPLVLNNNQGFVAANLYSSGGTRVVTFRICNAAGLCGTDEITVRTNVNPNVTPVRECVIDRGASANPRYQARFGYDNAAAYAVVLSTIPFIDNTFTSLPALRGQPQVFLAGARSNVFTTGFNSGSISWRLNGKTVIANSSSPGC